jgi:hypothetical protein
MKNDMYVAVYSKENLSKLTVNKEQASLLMQREMAEKMGHIDTSNKIYNLLEELDKRAPLNFCRLGKNFRIGTSPSQRKEIFYRRDVMNVLISLDKVVEAASHYSHIEEQADLYFFPSWYLCVDDPQAIIRGNINQEIIPGANIKKIEEHYCNGPLESGFLCYKGILGKLLGKSDVTSFETAYSLIDRMMKKG